MRKIDNKLVYAPTDLSGFLGSPFASWMNRYAIEHPDEAPKPDKDDPLQSVLATHGFKHEAALEQQFRDNGLNVVNIDDLYSAEVGDKKLTQAEKRKLMQSLTLDSLKAGADVIAQGFLVSGDFAGVSDFLVKVPGQSALGDWQYEVWDAKLARRVKPAFVIQLCCYAEMLFDIQQCLANDVVVALGNGDEERVRLVDCFDYYKALKQEFADAQNGWSPTALPDPADSGSHGRWSEHATQILTDADHLSLVATMSRSYIKRLEAAGVTTRAQLATLKPTSIPGIDPDTLMRLISQATLQVQSDSLDVPAYKILQPKLNASAAADVDALEPSVVTPRGLSRLPERSDKDVFFDIEGFPLVDGGLEYLWGCTYFDKTGDRQFIDWWAHDTDAECVAFEDFIDWVYARWQADPTLHIYHYANYEIAACKKLMGRYGTREHELDTLLRNHVFVDLYLVVLQGMQIGEPRYSIKNVEKLYRQTRQTDVASGGDSVVVYEHWREAYLQGVEGDTWETSKTLNGIRDYNIDDCDSTQELADWLRARQHDNYIAIVPPQKTEAAPVEEEVTSTTILRNRLLEHAQAKREGGDDHAAQLFKNMAGILEFHRRELKPMWWRRFDRLANTASALLYDADCLGMCKRTSTEPFKPTPKARNLAYEYEFNTEQDFKSIGSKVILHDEFDDEGWQRKASVLSRYSDLTAGLIVLQCGYEPSEIVSLVPDEFLSPDPIPSAIEVVVSDMEKHPDKPSAILDFLNRSKPRITGHTGGAIVKGENPEERLASTVSAVLNLDNSYLTVQGPPGCGKSFTGARIIAALCESGYTVGVASNSHAAIQNLLKGAANYCLDEAIDAHFLCTKKGDPELDTLGINVISNAKIVDNLQPKTVVGTTAWGFSREDLTDKFDYLLVDEAGQVSVANLVGMSQAANNIVLLGDQMQLGQPSQGTHPVSSGLSVLDYLMQGQAVIDDDMGVFLGTTYRMHSSVNQFVSEHFYNSELVARPDNDVRELVEVQSSTIGMNLQNAGIVFVPVRHSGNTQGSEEEAIAINDYASSLVGQSLTLEDGSTRALTWEDFLFVAPYNHQVKLLKQTLGDQAKVGSVDKFQGQEAPVVFLSLCTSDATESPRGIDFLFDPNRLNVALSRAETLVVVLGNPSLATTRVQNLQQLKKVNIVSGMMSG